MPNQLALTGILGGTFNPVHIGHLRLAAAMAMALHLEGLEFMPCAVPPHKPDAKLLPFAMRVTLLRAALDSLPQMQTVFSVSTLEAELQPPSYTWNLIAAWRQRHPRKMPLFILGAEDFANLDTWFRGLELPLHTSLAVAPRGDFQEREFRRIAGQRWPQAKIQGYAGREGVLYVNPSPETKCFFLPLPFLDISSSQIREKWLTKGTLQYLVPDPVGELLQEQANEVRRFWS